jgi:hypothetical protein
MQEHWDDLGGIKKVQYERVAFYVFSLEEEETL